MAIEVKKNESSLGKTLVAQDSGKPKTGAIRTPSECSGVTTETITTVDLYLEIIHINGNHSKDFQTLQ